MTRGALTRRAAMASVATALTLLALKAWAAWTTGSVAVLASLADTGLDLLASLVTLYAVRLAAVPADDDHRFGHGKAEALAALFQTGLILASAIAIGWRGVERLGNPGPTAAPEYGIAVSVIAIVLTLALVGYQRRVVARTGSLAIQTDSVHYSSDLLLNGAVIAALILDAWVGIEGADAAFGIAIALWLALGALRAARAAVDELMDKEWPDEARQAFLAVAARHPRLRGIHDLRTRTSGGHRFVQFHVWVDPSMTLAEAHRVMDEVETELRAEFPGVDILIHPDPDGHFDPPRDQP